MQLVKLLSKIRANRRIGLTWAPEVGKIMAHRQKNNSKGHDSTYFWGSGRVDRFGAEGLRYCP